MFYGLTYNLSWKRFHVYMRRMCIVLLLDKVFYWISLVCSLASFFYFLLAHLSSWSVHYRKGGIDVCNYYCWIVYFSLQFWQFFFIRFQLCCYAYIFIIIMSSWWINNFIIIKCSLFYLYQLFLSLFSCSVISNSLQPHGCSIPGFPVLHYLIEFLS